jgi:spermidine synthase
LSYILICLAPYGLLIGFVLPYAQKVVLDHDEAFGSGELYLADSVGDICGGFVFSFVLVYWFTPFATVAITSILLALTALGLLKRAGRPVLLILAFPCLVLFFAVGFHGDFEKRTLKSQYGEISEYIESPYGRILVSREGTQQTLWESGTPVYFEADVATSEERVHYPLSQLDEVRDVLLISGALGETLREIEKHHPTKVEYVELDPALTEVSLRLGLLKPAPFLEIVHKDARRYLRGKKMAYDAILVNLADPDTFQTNRFFTSEFFAMAKAALREGGVLCLSMEYSRDYVSTLRRAKLSSLYNTAADHFRHALVLPGQEAYFLWSDKALDPDIPSRLRGKGVRSAYIEGFFHGDVTPERIHELRETLDPREDPNRDFAPRLMNLVFAEWFAKYGSSPKAFVLVLGALCIGYFILMKREEYVLFSTGLSALGAEMSVIFSFQVIHGYIYLQIGAIVTAFLLGLLPGALVGNLPGMHDERRLLASDILISLLLILFLLWVRSPSWQPPSVLFLAYGFLFSFLCGLQFPVASKVVGEARRPAAALLSADLMGAALGGLAVGGFIIPLYGMGSGLIFLILVKISSSMLLGLQRAARH